MVAQPPLTEPSEAWHANEVLKEGPLISDLQRETIPENHKGNDTKVRQKPWIFREKIIPKPSCWMAWIFFWSNFWGTPCVFFGETNMDVFLSTGIDISINGWDVTGRNKSMFHGIFRSKTPATMKRFFWIQWNSSIGCGSKWKT